MSLEDKIAGLKSEQQELTLPYFNESVAWRIGCYIQARAEADNLPIAIEVSKAGIVSSTARCQGPIPTMPSGSGRSETSSSGSTTAPF